METNITGQELYHGLDPDSRTLWGYGWKRGYNDPWKDEANQRRMAKLIFGSMGGGGLLSLGFKAQDYLDPHGWDRPFHKSEEAKEKERLADIESRDDTPIIMKERKRLWKLYQRLGRMADLERYKKHVREFG